MVINKRPTLTGFLRLFEDVAVTFFDLTPDWFVLLDRNGCIRRVNKAFQADTGYEERTILGATIVQLIAEKDLTHFMRAFDQPWTRATAASAPAFGVLHRSAGVVRVQLVRYQFKPDTGEPPRGFLILRPTGG
jgi:PAS domain S-box-containing protein